MSRQLLAGYYTDTLLNSIRSDYNDKAIQATRDLLHSLSFFDTDLPEREPAVGEDDPAFCLAAVYHNYLQRGVPTHCTILVEEYLAKAWGGIAKKVSDTGSVEYCLQDATNEFTKQLFAALCIVDPRVKQEPLQNRYWQSWLGSDLEKRFLNEILLRCQGDYWLQLLEPQRSVTNILAYSYQSGVAIKELYNQPLDYMGEQRVDFAIELPCVIGDSRKGLILEVDGSQHLANRAQFNLDQYRDRAIQCLESTRWATLRARSAQWGQIAGLLHNYEPFFSDSYFKKIAENYSQPLYQGQNGLKALHLALTPMAVARIQRVLIELIRTGVLDFEKPVWKIGIVERDVDCAFIAIRDFTDFWERLVQLSGLAAKMPKVELIVYHTHEFACKELAYLQKRPIVEAKHFTGDVLIDISVLQRWGLSEPVRTAQTTYGVCIRSSHSKRELRRFLSAPLIRYQPVVKEEAEAEESEHITYLVQSAFRKKGLRPGQLPIINKALQYGSVIGLLPTGGGKSLTYQLCSLLQPGTTVVIDPIKSLMQDQSEGLKRNEIDATVFINSSLKTFYERKWAQDQLLNGRVLFAFISPERLQISGFRADLAAMANTNGHYFTYCVIDEAHCVSEWGHDFRTSYLRLGENARKYCKTWQEKQTIALFGLTATASFDVLSDVKRELKIGDEDVVSSLGTRREELLYQIHRVPTEIDDGITGYQASLAVGNAKVEKLKQILTTLPDDIHTWCEEHLRPANFDRQAFYHSNVKRKYDHAVLVFCPHKSEKSPMGVNFVAPRISGAPFKVGTFYGADSNTDSDASLSEKNQDLYIRNELNALVATKAFGMGIDKANVRSTVHFNFPSSIESFVQEAGRAGRDRKRAFCHVLYSDASHVDLDVVSSFHAANFKGEQHDFEMLTELLEEITYPADKVYNEIAQRVLEEVGEVVQINPWTGGNGRRLYVNRAYGISYGYIDADNLSKNLNGVHAGIGPALANEVLDYIIRYIRIYCPTGNYFEWVQSEIVSNSYPGIEKLLARTRVGERLPDVEISFRNDRIHLLTQLLKNVVDNRFTEQVVQRAAEYCDSLDEFQANLVKEFKKKENENLSSCFPLSDNTAGKSLQEYFYQIRDEIDTFKAVYRFAILGVIDDYEVDYAAKSIAVKATKKSDSAYVHHLEDYLSRYLSPKRVGEMMAAMKGAKKGSAIRDCAWTLIKYVYDFIGKKRSRAIREMQEVCETGVSAQAPHEVEKRIALYFTSKYTSDMLDMTTEGAEFSLNVVQHFITETEGVADNLEHLRGSSARILSDNPDNGALLLLRAYASLLLETKLVQGELSVRNQYLVDKALEDLENGLYRFEDNDYNLIDVLNFMRRELLLQNPGLNNLLEEISLLLFVKQHKKWLTNFNKQFIS